MATQSGSHTLTTPTTYAVWLLLYWSAKTLPKISGCLSVHDKKSDDLFWV
ncbi:hypothetical protein [Alysiella crassa]|nr:hypothetical protein [Alysiella crassa]UOP08307.1 hypothetical protein LVJ80_12190 [Alysiella crassa]